MLQKKVSTKIYFKHGRLKVRSTEEQKLLKQKEQQEKLKAYRYAMNQVAATRKEYPFNKHSLMLCAQVLTVNPDVYTLWNYRKEVVLQQIEMSKDKEVDDVLITFLENEIKLTEQCLLDNPKSYSSWHHRYWILQRHPKPNWQHEFNLITKYLTLDDRNFHCWDYRRLIINKIGISLCNELNFSTERLNINFSNYSSWHYRSTLRKLDSECLEEELELVQNAVFTDPNDSSAWFYFRWILSDPNVTNEKQEELLESLTQLLEMDPDCKCNNTKMYNNEEKRDMLSIFYSSNRNTTIASTRYLQMYPERQQPHRSIFLDLDRNLVAYGSFTKPHNVHANRNFNENRQNILQMINNNPSTSTREVASELNLSQSRVWRTLHQNRFKPYKIHVSHTLLPGDNLRRLEYWILMAKCWLTGSLYLTDNHFAEKRIMDYEKLKELDPLRSGQYSDYLECAKKAKSCAV
ncbi:protein farnesyltransferase alpha subunit/rab geranylgeranyl transferase alpha subunit [Holotrichia oblita]|uniref:Protein farnesyltransferase alpha subunit/rab geranylgeranyl transferase alpha subunit n=1 Tax=Holotrichia oblita TaxID=644536 RepID=A0ACB9TE05_HOLOL|nr:protein farnesyltransferase alpha subunit/rab geranylgeranyl transferase alpha subunit [Holotrichia oblita]